MNLTSAQQQLFWKLWAKAARAQGWDKEHGMNSAAIDAKRKAFLRDLGFNSLTEVDTRDGFSRVKRALLAMDDQIQGPLEEIQPEIESHRVNSWFIKHDLVPCLKLYLKDPWAYIEEVARDKFRGLVRLADLSDKPIVRLVDGAPQEFPSQIQQLIMTLSARLNGATGLRAKAGHTVHDMRILAGLPCKCSRCTHQPEPQEVFGTEEYDHADTPF
jgi:hypothetical protein